MTKLMARFLERAFTSTLVNVDAKVISVDTFSWLADGGPDECVLSIAGTTAQIWELYNLLRCPIEIYDELGRVVWWGYVNEVAPESIYGGASLSEMSNRVAATYSQITSEDPTGGISAETSYAETTASTDLFGDKELRLSLDAPCTTAQAEQQRDTALAERAYPVPLIDTTRGSNPTSARIYCRGWWWSCDWQYYANSNWRVVLEDAGQVDYTWGDAADRTKIAQSFQTPAAVPWGLAEFSFKLMKDHTVVDPPAYTDPNADVIGELWSDSGGSPNAVIESVTIPNANISPYNIGLEWEPVRFVTVHTLSPSTLYWLSFRRSNANNPNQYFRVKVCTGNAYTSGSMKRWDGAAWQAETSGYDIKFRALGERETTSQISDIVTASCQFLTGTQIDNASGVYATPYRAGDRTALEEITALLATGTTGDLRLHATITQARKMVVATEIVAGVSDYRLLPGGGLGDEYGSPIPAHWCTVGVWVTTGDIIPASASVSTIVRPERFFVTRATYNARTGRTNYEPKISAGSFDFSARVGA